MNKKYILLMLIIFNFFGIHGQINFSDPIFLTNETLHVQSVYAVDIDDDGDCDILSCTEYSIDWYENIDGLGNFSNRINISTNIDHGNYVFSSDIDGDGDYDVVSTSSWDDKIAWYENIDGSGNFSSQKIISSSANGAYSARACDIDGDGDMDIVASAAFDESILWYENTDGLGNFSATNSISTSDIGVRSLYTCDLDNDGDNDVITGAYHGDEVGWYRNDGNGVFSEYNHICYAFDVEDVYAADIDGDGDNDVLWSSGYNSTVNLSKNLDGQGNFGSIINITNNSGYGQSVHAADIDGDGDLDVLSSNNDRIGWSENIDGDFGDMQIIIIDNLNNTAASDVYAKDFDNDGDNDIVASFLYEVVIVKNYLPVGTEMLEQQEILIFPNPTNGIVSIEFTKNKIQKLNVFDIAGKSLIEKKEIQLNEQIDLSSLVKGIYIISIQTEEELFTKKIIKM